MSFGASIFEAASADIAITIQEHPLIASFTGLKSKAQSAANTRGISGICNTVKRVLKTRQKWVF
jgi:hypothetical protein